MPASKQISMRRRASATSVSPQALKNSFPPPKVPVPKQSTETLRPEPPGKRQSMVARMLKVGVEMQELIQKGGRDFDSKQREDLIHGETRYSNEATQRSLSEF